MSVEAKIDELLSRYESTLKLLGGIEDQVKEQNEKAKAAVEKQGELNAEQAEKVDKLLSERTETRGKLTDIEQQIAKLAADGPGTAARPQSWGQQVATPDNMGLLKGKGSAKFSESFEIKTAPQANITSTQADSSDGFPVEEFRVPGIILGPRRRLMIRDLLNVQRVESNSIEFVREKGFTNNAAPHSENPSTVKPKSEITYEKDVANVVTIAHHVVASKQVLSDASQLMGHIDSTLRYGLLLKEEVQLLLGSGVALNINGLKTQATAYSEPSGVYVQAENEMDRLRLAMLQLTVAEWEGDGMVLNPIDWTNIILRKDTQNQYLFSNPRAMTVPVLWGVPVTATNTMTSGEFLVGAFSMGATMWEREGVTVIISTEDRDNVVKNMVTILVEERIALTVYRPESFIKGNFLGLTSSGA